MRRKCHRKRLDRLRLLNDWTQEELAERLQIVNFLNYMERGLKTPNFENLERIAEICEISVASLFETPLTIQKHSGSGAALTALSAE